MTDEFKRGGEAAKGGADPSMEDILASIRRIIAEDGEARDAQAADAQADILELTEMVADDGSVVSLPSRQAEPEGAPLPAVEPVPEPATVAPLPAAPLPAPVPAPVTPVFEPDPDPLENFIAEAETVPPSLRDAAQKEAVMSSAPPPHDPLISANAASQARNAFAQLAEASRPVPVSVRETAEAGRTVEQLAEDLLRPMLKAWLDAHLPSIVEKAVAAEMARITGRNS
ncbi:DUF2497 domain-containing protein [Zavarzinia compransoris]|uniref:DUF2497 domain-containing protein n=1 Tax=Zavarzinia compransoris TaxID=1264899 RepID=A0A317EAM0_9PROT|nr:DUF2497 domain-containing protein [Zavarzinia compransoris]PWR23344.1 hypothetical protein DKG75_01900 [Zavarzinia compransoris]TDP46082.1 hypothetical protein DES42_104165 [Zavarzinia compransoris]